MPRLIGEQHPHHKLTMEAVKEIKATYRPGIITHAELAQLYGVKKQTIAKILNGETWLHVVNTQ